MGRKRVSVLIGCMMLVFSFWGCGSKAGGGDGADPSVPVAAAGPKLGQNTVSGTCGFPAASVLAIIPSFEAGPNKATVDENGFFSVYAYPQPAAILFLDGGDAPIGHLVFWNGMTSFPLENLPAGASSDLGSLSISGDRVTPARDPFSDGDLSLNLAEQRVLKITGSAFSSVAARPDADGNGRIDVLENKFYLAYMGYYISGSFAAGSLTGEVAVPAAFDHFDFCFQDQSPGSVKPTAGVAFTGPSGTGLSGTPARTYDPDTGKYCSVNLPGIPAGDYTAAYNGSLLSFSLPDQSIAPQDMLIIVPTVNLKSDGTIESLTWTYRLGDGTNQGAINPEHVITGLHIYMTDTAGNDRAYDSKAVLPASSTSHVLTGDSIPNWSDISHVEVDLYTWYGGCIIFFFSKAEAGSGG